MMETTNVILCLKSLYNIINRDTLKFFNNFTTYFNDSDPINNDSMVENPNGNNNSNNNNNNNENKHNDYNQTTTTTASSLCKTEIDKNNNFRLRSMKTKTTKLKPVATSTTTTTTTIVDNGKPEPDDESGEDEFYSLESEYAASGDNGQAALETCVIAKSSPVYYNHCDNNQSNSLPAKYQNIAKEGIDGPNKWSADDLALSYFLFKLSSCHKLKSNQFIETLINAFKANFPSRFDPFVFDDVRDFRLNSFITIRTKRYALFGFRNVFKTKNDGFIKYLGDDRFAVDFTLELCDLKCNVDCCIKLGHRWPKRIQLNNQVFTLDIDKCLIYVELMIDNVAKTINLERLSLISQQNIRCKTHCFNRTSFNRMFSTIIQHYFENYLANHVHQLECAARKHLSNSSILNYDKLIINTSLFRLLKIFPSSLD